MDSPDTHTKNDSVGGEGVSIVITTKNEEKNIAHCLESIRSQSYPQDLIETIVIDNKSDDRTQEIARRFTDRVFEKGPERSAQRNYGITSVARHTYALFLDADMILSPSLVECCVHTLKKRDYLGLYIPEIILGRGYWSRVRRFERSFYDGTVIDGVRFFTRDAFSRVGGFDESMSGPEDWDFDKKLKALGKLGLVEGNGEAFASSWNQASLLAQLGVSASNYGAVLFHNESRFHLRTYIAKKGYYAKDMDRYIEKWGSKDRDIAKQFGLYYRFWGVFVENKKWKRFFIRPGLIFGMYFLRFLVGLRFLLRKL